LLVLAALAAAAVAADDDPLDTDRPDFTESPVTVTRGRTQIETGYTYTQTGDFEEHAIGELLVRIGWTEVVELRVGFNSRILVDGPGVDISGNEDVSLGCKIRLSDPLPTGSRLPQVAVLLATTVPTGSDGLSVSDPQPSAVVALAWDRSERTTIGGNVGYARLGETGARFGEISASLSLNHDLSHRLGGYVEVYALARQEGRGDDQFVNAGLTWALSEDSQLDFRAGTGFASDSADFFVGAGAALRF
jgi:opacity protein-like surface antigen